MLYPIADIEAVCLQVGRSERAEGETAFPPIGRLESALKAISLKRRENAQFEADNERKRQYEERKRTHPEEFEETDADKAANARLDALLATKGRVSSNYRAVPRQTEVANG